MVRSVAPVVTLAALASVSPVSVSADHEVRDVVWTSCSSSAPPRLAVSAFDSQDADGDKIGFLFEGANGSKEAITGGTVKLSLKYAGIIPISRETALCEAFPQGCPLGAGESFRAEFVDSVPSFAPSAPVSGRLEMKADDGSELLCINLDAKIVKTPKAQKEKKLLRGSEDSLTEEREIANFLFLGDAVKEGEERGQELASVSESSVTSAVTPPLKMNWESCGDGDRVTVNTATIDPDPPVSGGDFSFSITGNLADGDPVSEGSIDLDLKFDKVIPFKKSIDLCQALEEAGKSCPISPGDLEIAAKTTIPSLVPSGKLTGTVKVNNSSASKNEELLCLKVDLSVSGKHKNFTKEEESFALLQGGEQDVVYEEKRLIA
uniref:MD-2-related lipid-recognition domain-containing protein n=1 Tax=Chromera velia CCMP2878 TaxID=1169474 RepID=A0A0G4GDY6_9ALVE|eukprot:Cvel_4555.t1-p1 / transcript=Cvel_4555.t1 / gene=Cvel_4555 / organism=Chromera_velia_CCMP2878 / gene_product=Putative phosphatidylglycerol/phosphatidylinositol, putative / transcript_product=Putative phosphatidylglycerol/phosphatidylinositol, putative / location=Cvel_scaffold200:936-8755(-) / protein_length=376 / sequence_SO=supercontig / SO=protein_coding / is_pseudo=false